MKLALELGHDALIVPSSAGGVIRSVETSRQRQANFAIGLRFFSPGQATSGRARAAPARAGSPDSKITEKTIELSAPRPKASAIWRVSIAPQPESRSVA